MSSAATLIRTADDAAAGVRLDRWLANQLPDRSRSEIQRWISAGQVTVDGKIARSSHRLEAGQVVTAKLMTAVVATQLAPEATQLAITYEDDDLLVIDKPAGMVVHPAPGHAAGTLVNAVLHHCLKSLALAVSGAQASSIVWTRRPPA